VLHYVIWIRVRHRLRSAELPALFGAGDQIFRTPSTCRATFGPRPESGKRQPSRFESAAANERVYMTADKLYGKGHHGHNVHFLITDVLLPGQVREGMEAAHELLGFKENPRSSRGRYWYNRLPQGWLD